MEPYKYQRSKAIALLAIPWDIFVVAICFELAAIHAFLCQLDKVVRHFKRSAVFLFYGCSLSYIDSDKLDLGTPSVKDIATHVRMRKQVLAQIIGSNIAGSISMTLDSYGCINSQASTADKMSQVLFRIVTLAVCIVLATVWLPLSYLSEVKTMLTTILPYMKIALSRADKSWV